MILDAWALYDRYIYIFDVKTQTPSVCPRFKLIVPGCWGYCYGFGGQLLGVWRRKKLGSWLMVFIKNMRNCGNSE
mgnify:CR=1 FL=1